MKANEIVVKIMEEKSFTKAQLGRAVGIDEKKATDLIGKRLKQENISVNILSEMLAVMGYTMLIVPNGAKVDEKKGEYEVTIK